MNHIKKLGDAGKNPIERSSDKAHAQMSQLGRAETGEIGLGGIEVSRKNGEKNEVVGRYYLNKIRDEQLREQKLIVGKVVNKKRYKSGPSLPT